MRRLFSLPTLFFVLLIQAACTMDLPRNMNLKAFDPHRDDFACRHESEAVPPIDAQAEQWLQEGLAATSSELPEDQIDYAAAAKLWQQAADRKHWKAMLNLASLYLNGQGVPRDTERAVQIVEEAMKLGIPGAFDLMGTLHMEGRGVKQNASRAYAFWELAADMGSASAQAYIGEHLLGGYDNPATGMWANQPVGVKMLECSFAQGNPKAAYKLGTWLNHIGIDDKPDHARALRMLHEGVKWGSDDSADYLSASFYSGDPMIERLDEARGDRYSLLARAMRYNRDLKYPNLDKVLPLPPAALPKWDGREQTLIDAARGLVPLSTSQATPGAERVGRAHIPDGHVLPADPVPLALEAAGGAVVTAQYEDSAARFSGYWLPQLIEAPDARLAAWNRAQVPLRHARGERFEPMRAALLAGDPRVLWHYAGLPVALPAPQVNPRVAQGVARAARIPTPRLYCMGDAPCPRTGVWFGALDSKHAQAVLYNRWERQAYLEAGQSFPDPGAVDSRIAAREVRWLWLDNANAQGFMDMRDVTLSDLHDAQGKPLA